MAKQWLVQMRVAGALVPSAAREATAGSNPFSGVLSLLGALLILAAVLFLAYKSTKSLAGRYSAQSMHGGYVEILERVVLAPDRSLLIVRLAGKVLLLGVTAHHIQKLDELDPGFYEESRTPPSQGAYDGFAAMLRDAVGGRLGGKSKKEDPHE